MRGGCSGKVLVVCERGGRARGGSAGVEDSRFPTAPLASLTHWEVSEERSAVGKHADLPKKSHSQEGDDGAGVAFPLKNKIK